jgi:hypothetical protein
MADGDEYIPPENLPPQLHYDPLSILFGEPEEPAAAAAALSQRRRRSSSRESRRPSSRRSRRRSSSRNRRRRSRSRSRSRQAEDEGQADAEAEAAAAAGAAAALEPVPEEEADEPEVFRSRHVDFDQYEQDPDDPILQPKFCVYCHVAMSSKQREMNPLLDSLLDLQRHHRSYMDPLAFCRMSQNEYNENIRPHIVDKYGRRYKNGAPAMHARHFWEHHIHHMFSPNVFHAEMAREVSSNILIMLQNGCKMKTKKRGVYVDDDKFWNVARIYDKFKPLLAKVGAERDTTLFGAT